MSRSVSTTASSCGSNSEFVNEEEDQAQFKGFATAHLRALESAHTDRLFNDPFAEPLSRKASLRLATLVGVASKIHPQVANMVAIRTRYLDEALQRRNPSITQVVIFGAGLDARAYRLESLRGCHVVEIDHVAQLFAHKSAVMKALGAPLIAKKVDSIVAKLDMADWDGRLRACEFDAGIPTFWAIEGILPYLDGPSNVQLLQIIDAMSAPGSELWVDMMGQKAVQTAVLGDLEVKYGEDDHLHGVLREIPWCLELQASLANAGTHFGREWTPLLAADGEEGVPHSLIVGKKPVPAEALEKELCPGLEW
ncbi:hypothetical protein BBJ28_00025350 [Nothophytophthora sp. Chile5]|nr:hypothetical protein BBJ28_00025350 [Nothophytophthora sp. Chile5]